MSTLRDAIQEIGGPEKAARICEVSSRAIYKWLETGHLPRTEYTGETDYAVRLAGAQGANFTAKQLRDRCRRPAETKPAA